MSDYISFLNRLVNICKKEYINFPAIEWINVGKAIQAEESRQFFLEKIASSTLFKETKPFWGSISPGCNICGQGKWSCLFITGKCNASCFYCPAKQDEDGIPESQGLFFETPEAYAEYVKYFGFKGVALSGGEPLMYSDRALKYLSAVLKSNPDIYTWMYTNGILGDKNIYAKLADSGLNEIRFDLGATGYNLNTLKKALKVISTVTVEIPAVPEDKQKVIELLPILQDMGVKYLNLHQMRLTPHNVSKLQIRPYTIIPAERPVVLESELAALEIISTAIDQKLEIGINYCSFFFKHRFQKAGYRKMIAKRIISNVNGLTEQGYICNYKNNKLQYKSLRLINHNAEEQIMNDLLELQHKSYEVQHINVSPVYEVTEEEYRFIFQDLTETKLENLSGKMFEIARKEFIEPGLRMY